MIILNKIAANKNAYAPTENLDQMIESLQEVDTFGTKEKIQNIQKMIDERKKIHQLENREVISKQDIKQSEIGFANFQIRNDVLLEEIKKGELIAIEKL